MVLVGVIVGQTEYVLDFVDDAVVDSGMFLEIVVDVDVDVDEVVTVDDVVELVLDAEVLVVVDIKLELEMVELQLNPSPSHPSSQMQKYDSSVSRHSACGSHGASPLVGEHSILGVHTYPSPS